MDDWLIKYNKWCGLWCINFINELARKFMYCKGMWKIDEWFFFAYIAKAKQESYFSYQKILGKAEEKKMKLMFLFFLLIKRNFSRKRSGCIFEKCYCFNFNTRNHNSV